jgi:ABC-2 type transport system ATP-binding protein
MTFALEADGLGKRYGSTWALRDCSFQLPAGRVAGLVGPNGAGKSTLMLLAMGLLEPTLGDVRIVGGSPRQDVRAVLQRVGFVAQNRPLYKQFTVAQLLEYGRRMNGRWDAAYAYERLRQYAIPLDRKAGSLSGGQQAQVSLALALGKRPDVLLLDEPMANLDPLARQEFLRTMLGAAAEEGTTILFSSHVVSELGRFCDYLVVLTEGCVRLAGDLDTLLAGHRRVTSVGAAGGAGLGRTDAAPVADEHAQCARLSDLPGVVSTSAGSGRQADALVRLDAWDPIVSRIGWREEAVTVDELILAYMSQSPAPQSASPMSLAAMDADATALPSASPVSSTSHQS